MKKIIFLFVFFASALLGSQYYGIQVGAYNTQSYGYTIDSLDSSGLPYDTFKTPDYKNKIIVGPFANITEARESLNLVQNTVAKDAFIISYTPKPTKKEGFVSIGIMGGTISPDATIYKDNIIPENKDQSTYGLFVNIEFYHNYALEIAYSRADKQELLFTSSNTSSGVAEDGSVTTDLQMLDINIKYYIPFNRYILPYVKVGMTGYKRDQIIDYSLMLNSMSIKDKTLKEYGAKLNYGLGIESYLSGGTYIMLDYSIAHKRLNFGIGTKLDF
jgi:hypothetical protein